MSDDDSTVDPEDVRDRLEAEADRAIEQFDDGVIELMAWVLDTETRARIYVGLRQNPNSTSDELSEVTGLYPSTVREALATLHEEGRVTRQKRESDGAGNNPYEYSAIPPSELVDTVVGDIQSELNTVFNLDKHLGLDCTVEDDTDPVTISVEEADENGDDHGEEDDQGDGDQEGDDEEDGNEAGDQ
jgi:predicted transcriptional regulator